MGIFGRKQQATQTVEAVVQQDKTAPHVAISDEDRRLLEDLIEELHGCLVSVDEEPLLTDAETVTTAHFPVPAFEIEYPDFCVTWTPSIYHYTDEDRA